MEYSFVIPTAYDHYTIQGLLDFFRVAKKKISQLERNRSFFVNGVFVPFTSVLQQGDFVSVDLTDFEGIDYPPAGNTADVIYEDDFILAVDKPVGLIVYDLDKSNDNSLANKVAVHYLKTNQDLKIRHLHRLDKDTSGIVLYGKHFISHAYYSALWDTPTVERKYLAIVEGSLEKATGTLDFPIGSNRHVNNQYVVSKTGKPAVTHYRTIKKMKDSTLVECTLETGRTHQIRVHFGHMGHPLVGDAAYGSKQKAPRCFLHSSEIRLYHPILCQTITITKGLPGDMQKYLSERGIYEY